MCGVEGESMVFGIGIRNYDGVTFFYLFVDGDGLKYLGSSISTSPLMILYRRIRRQFLLLWLRVGVAIWSGFYVFQTNCSLKEPSSKLI